MDFTSALETAQKLTDRAGDWTPGKFPVKVEDFDLWVQGAQAAVQLSFHLAADVQDLYKLTPIRERLEALASAWD